MISKFNTKKRVVKKPKSKIYSNRIKAVLNETGMTQQELADRIETNPAHLSRIVSGQRKCISLPIAIKIAQALDRTVEELFDVKEE